MGRTEHIKKYFVFYLQKKAHTRGINIYICVCVQRETERERECRRENAI